MIKSLVSLFLIFNLLATIECDPEVYKACNAKELHDILTMVCSIHPRRKSELSDYEIKKLRKNRLHSVRGLAEQCCSHGCDVSIWTLHC
uniref:Insulin-like domain-containing protein n=1 Tax=Tetranychus urticae TaxID=32264 RepID=T1KEZ3_TETUR